MTRHTKVLCFASAAVLLSIAAACSSPSSPQPPPPIQPPLDTFTTISFQRGTALVLENATAKDTFRVAVDTAWGGSIVEVSMGGVNYVNAHDPGREVQLAFYDGNAQYDDCAGCTGTFGWDPVQAGDRYSHGSGAIGATLGTASLYTKSQPIQWYPDDKGGGPSQSVVGDMIIEQTVTPVTGHAAVFQVHYVITHLGSDLHTNGQQEMPAVYANAEYDRFVYYGGGAPWTSGAVTATQFPVVGTQSPLLYDPEHWAAYLNAQNVGLTVYDPTQYPYVVGFHHDGPGGQTGDGTNYFAPFVYLTIGPGYSKQGDYYVIAGDMSAARQIIYALHELGGDDDIATPFGSTDQPVPAAVVSGATPVSGWAMDNVSVATVQVEVDGVVDGTATYGLPRPDVAHDFPHAPVELGFSYSLDTTKYPNGTHVLNVRATDHAGNVAVFPGVSVTVSN